MSGDSVRGCAVRYPQSGWEAKKGNSVGHRGCTCGHWQGGFEMGCRKWLSSTENLISKSVGRLIFKFANLEGIIVETKPTRIFFIFKSVY